MTEINGYDVVDELVVDGVKYVAVLQEKQMDV